MRCSVFIALTLDGFIARPDGRIDWLDRVQRTGEDYGYGRFFASADTMVVGRSTYELAATFDPFPYAGKRCIVLTHRPLPPRDGVEVYAGPLDALVARLERDGAARAYVDGGAVIQQFLAAGLVTDATLSIVPVLVGDGIRLFGATGRDLPLDLVATRAFESGLVQIEYAVKPVGSGANGGS